MSIAPANNGPSEAQILDCEIKAIEKQIEDLEFEFENLTAELEEEISVSTKWAILDKQMLNLKARIALKIHASELQAKYDCLCACCSPN